MKLIDKFLKKLNVNRNTFVTYILTLVTVYLAVDRIVEMLLMIFTGVATSYWGPIGYTFALACPVFAFAFSGASAFSDTRAAKVSIFYVFLIGFYIIALSLFTQGLNMLSWLLLISAPSYVTIVSEFSDLIKPAFCAISLYLPLTTIYPFVKAIILKIDDTQSIVKSLWDFKGINLANESAKHGPYACDISLFKDFFSSERISFHESRRFQALFVCGASGTGKTSMIFEPSIAQDIEKKYFFREASKELGFTALKTGIANLSAPYSNDYLNKNFNLNMLTPSFGKDTLFNTFVKKMVISSSPHNVYKDIGITYLSPDYDTLSNMMSVCDNFGVGYNIIDPSQPAKSLGLNPFVYDDPSKIAVIISSTLQGLINVEADGKKEAYREEVSIQIIENLAILLKVMYPRMNDGVLPNMEDLLTLLSNFSLVEKMCKIMEKDPELAERYHIELSYFRRSFFADGKGKQETEANAYYIASRLENLLRAPSIRAILCNRYNNINFDDVLKNGEVIFICTRRGESGKVGHKSFGLFFLLSFQNAVLSRPGNESSRIPHFLYIDEFPNFLSRDTETMFTMYRKYKVATTISAQNLSQLNLKRKDSFNNTILSNCASKIYTGGSSTVDELTWWSSEIGQWKQWEYKQDYDGKTGQMSTTLKEPGYKYVTKMTVNSLQNLKQNHCAFRILQDNGKAKNGEAIIYALASKYKEKHESKKYDFEKYINGSSSSSSNNNGSSSSKKNIFNRRKFNTETYGETDPIRNADTKYKFDDEDIVIDLKNENNN